jgi:CRISPR system Cascade subunit CasD
MDVLLLRLDAPLMSFGGVMVDHNGPTDRFPGVSLLAGLLGNALGLRHRDADALQALQARIEFAARWDVAPRPLRDYHTVDLGQPKMRAPGWTTRGAPEHRAGGAAAAFGTHQRYRHYWANGILTVALTLLGEDLPTVNDLADALRAPARPLFLGRKTCLPATPLLLAQSEAPDVLTALRAAPRARRSVDPDPPPTMEACWPVHLGAFGTSREVAVYDRRDWHNQVHAGRRLRMEGLIEEEAP